MQVQFTKNLFSDQSFYVGIDYHKKYFMNFKYFNGNTFLWLRESP